MRARIAVPGLLALLMLGGCGTGDAGAGPLSTSKVVGPAGGLVDAGGGLRVSIPAGALAADTTIEIGPASSGAPAGYGAAGALYEFKPQGQVFAHPVTVSMPLPAGVSRPTIYWSLQITSSVWDDDGGKARGSSISTGVLHFSGGFVGEATGSGLSWIFDGATIIPTLARADCDPQICPSGNGIANLTVHILRAPTRVGGVCERFVANSILASRDLLALLVTQSGAGAQVLAPGTFVIGGTASAQVNRSDASCALTPVPATAGTITIDSLSPSVAGSVDLTMADGQRIAGPFARRCAS